MVNSILFHMNGMMVSFQSIFGASQLLNYAIAGSHAGVSSALVEQPQTLPQFSS